MKRIKSKLSIIRFFPIILLCSLLISCENLFEDKTDKQTEQTFILTGRMVLDGAMPQFAADETSDETSRSAFPELSESGVEYFVYAVDADDNTVDGSFGSDENAKTFTIPLILGKQWTVTCGMRKIGGSQEEFLTASSTPKTYTISNFTEPLVLFPVPAATGEGEIELSMSVPTDVSNVTLTCESSDWINVSVEQNIGAGGSNKSFVIKSGASGIRSGVYKINLGFEKGTELVYQTTQTINVFYGLKTTLWYDAVSAGIASPIKSDGSFVLTEELVNQCKTTKYYVGPTGATGAVDPSDFNNGSHKAPFETLGHALEQIQAYGLPAKDYTIYISGMLSPQSGATQGFEISSLDAKMKSLTIKGINSNTTDIISGGESFRALTISTSKKVMLKDLTITKGLTDSDDSNKNGAGINFSGEGKLIIENCIITDNKASGMGGGIYSSGNVQMISTKVINNETADTGDGIYVFSGTFTMSGGEVSGNKSSLEDSAAVYIRKGSIFNFDGGSVKDNNRRGFINHGTLDMTAGTISGHTAIRGGGIYNNGLVTMSGGSITGNTATGNGGGIYVNAPLDGVTPGFTMTGGTISGNSSAAYGGGVCNASEMTITGGEISGNQITGTEECGGGAITSFVNFTLGKDAYIPAGTEGKNDVYLYDSGDGVTKFHIELTSSLTQHDSTAKIMLQPGVYAEERPMLALTGESTADLTAECEKFGVTPDATQPVVQWSVDTEGKLVYTVPFENVTTSTASFDGTTAISSSPVFISGRNLGSIKSLIVSDHETTQGEYETYCTYGGDAPSATFGIGEYYPAYYVSWYDAIVYCNLLSKHDNLNPVYSVGGKTDPTKWNGIVGNSTTGYCAPSDCDWYVVTDDTKNGWRLPYEAEWEYIWREGNLDNENQHTYCGDDNPGKVAWYTPNSSGKTHVVKTKKPNSLEIYDMCGNVWEWMNDWHSWPIPSDTPITGVTYETADPKNHVTRGGGYRSGTIDSANAITASGARNSSTNNYRNDDLGFRVVRNAVDTSEAYPRAVSTTYIGTKTPSEVREVFDIIFTDGSAIPYTEGLALTDTQKAAAIAVIFYKGSGLNKADDTSVRTLGVGLVKQKNLPWAGENTQAISKNISDIQGAINSGDKYGKDNLQAVSDFLTNAHASDESITDDTVADATGKINNYPVFDYAVNYKTKATAIADTSFATDWYIPTISELNALSNEIVTVNAAISLCGKDTFSGSFWSSNQNQKGYNANANNLTIIPGQAANMTPNGTSMTNGYQMWTCAIREF